MGVSTYSVWLILSTLTAYFGLLDIGTRGSLGRNVAFYRAKNDPASVNSLLNTALAITTMAGFVAIALTFVARLFFLKLFPDIKPELLSEAQIALLIVGIGFALSVPTTVFDAMLWAYQRFDIINMIDICGAGIRTAMIVYYISRGHSLVALALVMLVTTQFLGLAKAIAVFLIDRELRLGVKYITRSSAKQLVSYGSWTFVLSVSRILTSQCTSLLVGNRLGVNAVTPYSFGSRLLAYGSLLVSSSAGVLTPIATGLHAGDKDDEQKRLFLDGGKFCTAFSFFFVSCFLLLGPALLRIWLKGKYPEAATLLMILAIGDAIPMGQLLTNCIILGKGKPKVLAMINFSDGIGVVLSAFLLTQWFGLIGLCVGFAVSGFLFRGMTSIVLGSRLVGVPWYRFFTSAIAPAFLTAIVPAGLLAVGLSFHSPQGWIELFIYGGVFSGMYLVSVGFLIGPERVRAQLQSIRRRFQ
jgi:O-antigen/teichoic acid export membrane protein